MKIALFTDTFAPDVNGVAMTLKRLIDYLEAQGIDYRVFAPKSAGQHFTSEIYAMKSLPFFLYPECRMAFPNMLHVKEELQQFQPDLIHVATPFNVGLCGLYYAKKLGIPVVGSYHTDFDKYLDYYEVPFLKKLLWRYMRWFHRPLRKIFVPSKETMQQLQRHGFTNLAIWSRGIDCKLFHPNRNQQVAIREQYHITKKHILLYVGRIAPEKDVMLLPLIHEQLPAHIRENVHWIVVGDGPQKEALARQAPEQMTLAGFLNGEGLADVYAAAELFVFPSATETFGNVVLESLASGTPVVCANEGGVRSIVNNGVTGLLCERNNTQQFAKAITELVDNNHMRKEMGYNGRQHALNQSWNAIFETLLKEYEASLEEKQIGILA